MGPEELFIKEFAKLGNSREEIIKRSFKTDFWTHKKKGTNNEMETNRAEIS